MLSSKIKGLQHLGIPVEDLDQSIHFYESLGFETVHRKRIKHNQTQVEAAFIQLDGFILELYHVLDEGMAVKPVVENGRIDHFAMDVTEIEALYKEMKQQGYNILDEVLQEIDFYENGVVFFRILG